MSAPALHRFGYEAMRCTWGLDILHAEAGYAAQAAQAAFDEVDRLEAELSRFRPTSDVARVNAARVGETVPIGADCHDCLRLAQRVWRATGGAFDVTYNSRVGASAPLRVPSADPSPAPQQPAAADAATGGHMSALRIADDARAVTILSHGVHVDLGAIGKGYALDRVLAVLDEWSIAHARAHCGQSTVAARGRAPGGAPWTAAVRHPQRPDVALREIHLQGRALSGSGNALYRPHVRDPRTGDPASGALAAWALTPSASLADALSTAFLVMAPAEVEAFCAAQPGVGALLAISAADPTALREFGLEHAGGARPTPD